MSDPLSVRAGRTVQQPLAGASRGIATPALLGRLRECAALDHALHEARNHRSASLVLSGEAGSGKSALIDHARASAEGFQVLRCSGVESERELPYAGLHQLYLPLMARIGELPGPQ